MKTIYFDYNATTPLDPSVRQAMLPFLDEIFGNPSSAHHVGRRARALLDDARERVAGAWRCKPSEVVFSSGGTESNNLAILGTARALRTKGRHLITSTIEHHAVLNCFEYLEKHENFGVTYLPASAEGLISPDDLKKALRPDTTLVSLMSANNEMGAIQPVAEFGEICRARGVLFHTDALQSFGKEPFAGVNQFNADLVSFCAHKLHGPKGAGALFIKSPLHPEPIILGGSHENERRAGTENVPAIIGMAHAVENFLTPPIFPAEHLNTLTTHLIQFLDSLEGVQFRGSKTRRLSNTVAFTVEGCDSATLLAGLDLEGICASSGSACASGALEPSHVMSAMGVEKKLASSLVRFSLGRDSTVDEVLAVEEALRIVIKQARTR
ncbi:MAG TPA: cysteine desulfurase family protein [Verrucomicrobiae bacterium]|jgi:cysteine desulfurase|nr:cysteine desulfurase family protein [Verrucomicrobiae bacterium]